MEAVSYCGLCSRRLQEQEADQLSGTPCCRDHDQNELEEAQGAVTKPLLYVSASFQTSWRYGKVIPGQWLIVLGFTMGTTE